MIKLEDDDVIKGPEHLQSLIDKDIENRREKHSRLISFSTKKLQNKHLSPKAVFAKNSLGETPLHRYSRCEDIFSLDILLRRSPDLRRGIDRVNNANQSAIQVCLLENHMRSAIFLYRNGALVDEMAERRITEHSEFNKNFFSRNPLATVDSTFLRKEALKNKGLKMTNPDLAAAASGLDATNGGAGGDQVVAARQYPTTTVSAAHFSRDLFRTGRK